MRPGFIFDMNRCIGCKACQVACKDRFSIFQIGPRPRRVLSFETGRFPSAMSYHLSIGCNHCEHPACVRSCPAGAMMKRTDGVVVWDEGLCISCGTCAKACPYGAPQYVPDEGRIYKCDSCLTLRSDNKNPVCVDSCALRALSFVDFDDIPEESLGGLVSDLPCLPKWSETEPNLRIRPKKAAQEIHFRALLL